VSELKALVAEDRDFLRSIVQIAVQEFLEAEMNAALGAGKGERSGYYPATLGNAERAAYARLDDKGECAAFRICRDLSRFDDSEHGNPPGIFT